MLPPWIGASSVPAVPDPANTYAIALKLGFHGSDSRSPAWIDAWMMVIGVWVEPGPTCPSTSPAITRMIAPASGLVSSRMSRLVMPW